MCPKFDRPRSLRQTTRTDRLGAQITQVVTNTKFNGVALIDVAGTAATKTVQLDTSGSNSMDITDTNFLTGAGMAKLVAAAASFDSTPQEVLYQTPMLPMH